MSAFKDTKNLRFKDFSSSPLDVVKDSVVLKKFYGLLYIPKPHDTIDFVNSVRFYGENAPTIEILNTIERVINNKLTETKLIEK